MELRVEAASGAELPVGSYVGVRIGEVLKQGRYEASRCYHFPRVDRRRNAKIDIYQHVGSAIVAVDPDAKNSSEVAVQSTDPNLAGIKLKVHVQSNTTDVVKEQREAKTKALKSQAKDYLSKHSIEERLSEAVKALLREQPGDPTEFLVRHLRGDTAPPKEEQPEPKAPVKPIAAEPKAEVKPAPQPSSGPDLAELRKQACDVLLKASHDGNLAAALQEARSEVPSEGKQSAPAPPAPPAAAPPSNDVSRAPPAKSAPPAAAAAAAAPAPAPAPAPAAASKPAPVILDTNFALPPAMAVSSVQLYGPQILDLGLAPSLTFF